ncbi:MAG: chromosome partitioning protein ParB, partial [Rudanella sp.]|nr:chromosome partitioning protein ParB [Rudanella sp.]
IKLFKKIVDEDWSVRKVEEAVRNLGDEDDSMAARKVTLPRQEIRSLQFRLSSMFGTKVSIKADEKHRGEIKIPFTSQEELDKILLVLNSSAS